MFSAKTKQKIKTNLVGYSLILPSLLGYLIFVFIPICFAVVLSFTEWNGSATSDLKFVALDNFIRLFYDDGFRISFFNTVYYAVFTVPLTLAFSLLIAVLLNKKIKGMTVFRTAFFFPYIASIIAVGAVWNMLFQADFGPINTIIKFFGVTNPPGWTASVNWAMPAVIIVSIWRYMGYYMLIYLAGLQGIPSELYEAASIDGATGFRKFWYITVPMLYPTTFFVAIMLTIQCFKVFDLIYIMTQGGPGRSTNVLVNFIYNGAFVNSEFGYASSAAIILFIVVLTITVIQFRGEKKYTDIL